jgi:hypothetical protein
MHEYIYSKTATFLLLTSPTPAGKDNQTSLDAVDEDTLTFLRVG